jgi:N-acetylglucosamine-6-phosphate deacetylase
MLTIHHAGVYTPETFLPDAAIEIEGGIIRRIGTSGELAGKGGEHIDAGGNLLAPGFMDLQVNGAFGDDFTANPETIWQVAEQLPRLGVTAFLPTLVTCPPEQTHAARAVLRARPDPFHGAEPLGLHIEGPFLNPKKKGAHNPAYLRLPDLEYAREWSRANGVWLVTLAPELPGATELVRELAGRGVVVSMGHTLATVEEADAGYAAGIRYATHLFNAMPPLEHRAPNAPGAVLANRDWVAGIIPDGIHLHPALVKSIRLAKGARVNLVSDAMAALGRPPGTYRLHDFNCIVSEDSARLEDGTLAGSILPLDAAVRNYIEFTGCSPAEAFETVTTVPARLLGVEKERGMIAEGMIADVVMLNAELQVELTIARGVVAYAR